MLRLLIYVLYLLTRFRFLILCFRLILLELMQVPLRLASLLYVNSQFILMLHLSIIVILLKIKIAPAHASLASSYTHTQAPACKHVYTHISHAHTFSRSICV